MVYQSYRCFLYSVLLNETHTIRLLESLSRVLGCQEVNRNVRTPLVAVQSRFKCCINREKTEFRDLVIFKQYSKFLGKVTDSFAYPQ